MPVPTSWADIHDNPAENSPGGNETIGTQADDYIRQAFAFASQNRNQSLRADGTLAWAASQDAGTHTVKNLAAPVAPTDAATKGYVDSGIAANFPRGVIMMWYGGWGQQPAGWLMCDGTNGTPDLRNRMPFGGDGVNLGPGGYGGANSLALQVAHMPWHSHAVVDNGHGHNMGDNGHSHGVNDGQHSHSMPNLGSVQAGSDNGGAQCPVGTGYSSGRPQQNTNGSGANISIQSSGSNVWVQAGTANISLQGAGGGAAFDLRSAWVSVYFIMKA